MAIPLKILHSNLARLLILTFMHFVIDMMGGLLIPLPEPTLVQHLGVSLAMVAVLVGGSAIIINAVQPVSGWLLPASGMPMLLVFAPLAAALIAFIGLTNSYWIAGILLVTAGIGIGVLHPEGVLTAHELSGKRTGLGMSLFMSGGYFGFASGSLVSGLWVEYHEPDLANFWLLALPAVLVVVLVLLSGLHRLRGHDGESNAGHLKKGQVPFLPVMLLAAAVAGTVCLFVRLITIWLVRRFPGEAAQGWGGATVFATGLAGAFAGIFWGHMSDRFGRARTIAVAQFLCIPFLYGIFRITAPSQAPLWGIGIGLTLSGVFPLTVVLAREAKGFGKRLRVSLAIGGAWGFGEILFMFASHYVASHPQTAVLPVESALKSCWLGLILIVLLALTVSRWEKSEEQS